MISKTSFFSTSIILILLFCTSLNISAIDTKIEIKKVIGIYYGHEDLTLKQIKQLSLSEAKVNALKKAGIVENINAYSQLFKSETDNQYGELFSSDILTNIRGNVTDVKILDLKIEITKEQQIKVTTTIFCTVIKYNTKPDLTFNAKIEGFKTHYNTGNPLTFSVNPSKDTYVKVFIVSPDEDESFVIFPNDYEKSFLLKKDEKYIFPSEKAGIEITVDTKNKEENFRAITILLKEDIPFVDKVTYKNITNWMNTIPLDEKKIISNAFIVFGNK